MKVVADKTIETHTYTRKITFEAAGVEVVPAGHWSHKGKSYQPEHVVLKWAHGHKPTVATVIGKVLKANGEVGEIQIRLEYGLTSAQWRHEAPAWLNELVAA